LAQRHHDDAGAAKLIADDQQLLRDLWTATVPAFQSIRTIDFSSSFVDSVNQVVRADADRKAARRAQIPTTVIVMLIFYSLIAAALLGAVMKGRKGEAAAVIMLSLSVLALMLIVDINRPVSGTIHESQEPMKRMLMRLKANPPAVYQRLAQPAVKVAAQP
jgi:ABC-type transport system involved in cytochrome bd biosynthesis fused ATPase/permease subunit